MMSSAEKIRVFLLIFVLTIAGFFLGFAFFPAASHSAVAGDNCPTNLHYSYFSSRSFYDTAYQNALPAHPTGTDIRGVLINHHLLAPHLIAETIGTIATTAPVTVVLVSPNHFNAGAGDIISSRYRWDTPYGTLASDCTAIDSLRAQGVLSVEESPFEKEHGISGIVPFIKKSLPNARVIPIIVKDTLSDDTLDTFVRVLRATINGSVLIVGSFDFSHYLPDTAAQFHDRKSLSVIQNFDYAGIKALDTDSIPGLEIVLKYLDQEGARHFDLLVNTNSAEVLHDPSLQETTSYIDGAFSIGTSSPDHIATILAFGDLMLDRSVRQKIAGNGARYPFLPLKRFLLGSDIVVANAEEPFTLVPSKTINVSDAPLTFTFDPGVLHTLKRLGFTLLSQANNHALNFGEQGLQESEQFIESAGLNWFGDPLNRDHPFTATIRGEKITLIGYHEFTAGGTDATIAAIRSAKQAGAFVIVYPHWGTEYLPGADATQTHLAHAFIDAGADTILGSHPHVIEPIEIYKGKVIFYSLGNFVFDQTQHGPTAEGLSVGITLTPDTVSYSLFPLNIRNEQASLMNASERATLLNDLAEQSGDTPMRESIIQGLITIPRS